MMIVDLNFITKFKFTNIYDTINSKYEPMNGHISRNLVGKIYSFVYGIYINAFREVKEVRILIMLG